VRILSILLAAALGACGGGDDGGGGGGNDGYCDPGGGAYFRMDLSGGTDLSIDAVAGDFGCGGISAQDGSAFSSSWGGLATQHQGSELAVILDVNATRGETGTFTGDITVTQGASEDATFVGGIWSPDADACSLTITEHEVDLASDIGDIYVVSGTGTCPTLSDGLLSDEDVTMSNFEFSGVTVWLDQ
jgi:hypothetical protein